MTLEEFLQYPYFNKYKDEVEGYKKEFKDEGCELFLFQTYSESKNAMEYTKELSNRHTKVLLNEKVEQFIRNLSEIDKKDIFFIYPEDYSHKFFMCQEIAKNAKKSYVLKNIFEEDDTINWIAIFDSEDILNIGMMVYLVYSNSMTHPGDNYGGYKMFERGLMFYAGCLQYDGKALEPEWPNYLAHFQGNQVRRDENPRVILESRKVIKMLIRLGYFEDEYEIFVNMYKELLPFLHSVYEKAVNRIKDYDYSWKDMIIELKSRLIAEGVIISKWKHEQSLFLLIKKKYIDALFQYRPKWLEPQNLDIYIPSLNLGIEYQGIQHYESVDFFGGEKALMHRKELDQRKRILCEKNGIKLLEWPYTDEITNKMLKYKLSEYNI